MRLFIYGHLLLVILRMTLFLDNSSFNMVYGLFLISSLPIFLIENKAIKVNRGHAKLLVILLLIIVISFVSVIINGHNPYFFFYDLARYVMLLSLFMLGRLVAQKSSFNLLYTAIIIIAAFHFTISTYKLISGEILVVHGDVRLSGYFENTGHFGTFCALLFIMLHLSYVEFKRHNKAILIVMLMSVLFMAMNNTLRAIATIIVSYFIYFVINKRNFIYILLIPLLALGLYLFNDAVFGRLASVLTSSYDVDSLLVTGTKLDNSFQWRFLQWYRFTSDWIENYLILGVGIGQETYLEGFKTKNGDPFIAHSDFVKIICELGLVGFLFIIPASAQILNLIKNRWQSIYLVLLYFIIISAILGSTIFTPTFIIFLIFSGFYLNQKSSMT